MNQTKCIACGSTQHYIVNCPSFVLRLTRSDPDRSQQNQTAQLPQQPRCVFCGRPGHTMMVCRRYKRNQGADPVNNNNKKSCQICQRPGHNTSDCWHNQTFKDDPRNARHFQNENQHRMRVKEGLQLLMQQLRKYENRERKRSQSNKKERICIPQAKESRRGNGRQSEQQTNPNREKGLATRTSTAVNSHHISCTDIPAVIIIAAPSTKPKRLIHIFLMALLAVTICLGAFWAHHTCHRAHSLNEQPILHQTNPYTSDLDSTHGGPNAYAHTKPTYRKFVTQQSKLTKSCFEPG